MYLKRLKMYSDLSLAVSLFCIGTTALCQNVLPLSSDRTLRAQSYEVIKQYMGNGRVIPDHEKCGFAAISYAIRNRDRLSPEVRTALTIVLQRPTNQKSILVGAMRVHYDTTGDNAPAMLDSLDQKIPGTADQYADSVAAIANYCATFETQMLGYLPIPSDGDAGGGPEHDIYVTNLGDYGFTTPDSALLTKPNGGDGGTWTSFTTIDNSFQFVNPPVNKGMPGLRVTLAHELHHSIQIGNYGYWSDDIFFYEITSVWMEDVVFPAVKDYLQYTSSSEGHFANPGVPFNSDDFIMYSRAIWAHFVAKRFGRDAMLQTWRKISLAPPLQAIDLALNMPHVQFQLQKCFCRMDRLELFHRRKERLCTLLSGRCRVSGDLINGDSICSTLAIIRRHPFGACFGLLQHHRWHGDSSISSFQYRARLCNRR